MSLPIVGQEYSLVALAFYLVSSGLAGTENGGIDLWLRRASSFSSFQRRLSPSDFLLQNILAATSCFGRRTFSPTSLSSEPDELLAQISHSARRLSQVSRLLHLALLAGCFRVLRFAHPDHYGRFVVSVSGFALAPPPRISLMVSLDPLSPFHSTLFPLWLCLAKTRRASEADWMLLHVSSLYPRTCCSQLTPSFSLVSTA